MYKATWACKTDSPVASKICKSKGLCEFCLRTILNCNISLGMSFFGIPIRNFSDPLHLFKCAAHILMGLKVKAVAGRTGENPGNPEQAGEDVHQNHQF